MDQRSLNDAGIEDNDSFIISRKTVVSHSQARQQHRTAISKQAEEARRYILANEQVRQQLLQVSDIMIVNFVERKKFGRGSRKRSITF